MPAAVAVACAEPDTPRAGDVVLFGNANVGKSALFGALTGRYVTVSNYPGTTVEVAFGTIVVDGRHLALLDTPGAGSFLASSEDERVARDVLLQGRPLAAVVVADAKNLERGLLLAIELGEMGQPIVFCLNMVDEAADRGLRVDAAALARALGAPVVPTVAVRRQGTARLLEALPEARVPSVDVRYPEPVEQAVARLAPVLPAQPIAARALALMALAGDDTLAAWLRPRLSSAERGRLDEVWQELRRSFPVHLPWALARARRERAARLAAAVVRREAGGGPRRPAAEALERLTTHPVWGLPFLAATLYALYLLVGVFGAGTLVDLLEDGLFGQVINPAAVALAGRLLPWGPVRDLLVGPYGIVTMALTYSLALVLPIVATFFIAFGALEDSGYLPRLAVMVNRVFRRMGLNGKAVLPMVLGLGCDTMATLTTRILETRKERLIAILLLALGVPCSAQMAVVLGLLAPLPAAALLLWAGVVLGVLFVVGRLAARLVPGAGSDLVLELPPIRLPRAGNILAKTLGRVEWYLKEAVPLFVLGTVVLFMADRLQLLAGLQRVAAPVVERGLGLPAEAAGAFLIGFLRRDFGAAGLYRLANEGRLDPVQTLVAAVTITLFMPCIANFFMVVRERGWRTAVAVASLVVPLAVGVGALLNATFRAWPRLP